MNLPLRTRQRRTAIAVASCAAVLLLPALVGADAAELSERVRARLSAADLMRQTEAIVRHQRPSGSAGENAAIDHIVATLRSDGIPVELHTFSAYVSDPVSATVRVSGSEFAPDAITAAYSGSVDGLEAPAVYLGSVQDLPAIDVYSGEALTVAADARVQGRIALVDGLPMPEAAWKLQAMGAVGAVFVNPAERLNELITTTVWGTPSLRSRHRDPQLPVAQVRHGDGQRLIEAAAAATPLRLSVVTDTGWRPLRLAVARIMPAPEAPYVLLGGHIDSWYHGANDEGASNAAMLELARAFWAERAELRHGLVVAWWPGHSNGRYAGSTWFADHFFDELSRRAIAYMNIDGIGQMDAARFGANGTASMAGLARRTAERIAGLQVQLRPAGRNSDQAFNGIGLPLLQFSHSRRSEDGGYWWWHTAEDTLDKVEPEVLEIDTELYADALAWLLGAEIVPLDPAAEIDLLIERLAAIQMAAGDDFDMSQTQALARALQRPARELPRDSAMVLVEFLRPIYRVIGTRSGAFHPDPAIEVGLLPGLAPARGLSDLDPASDLYGFTLVELRRELNRVDAALRQAAAVTRAADR